jgi:hypothetical protein
MVSGEWSDYAKASSDAMSCEWSDYAKASSDAMSGEWAGRLISLLARGLS